MTMKGSGEAEEWREIDQFEGGVGWIAHPEERMQRASHALLAGADSTGADTSNEGGDEGRESTDEEESGADNRDGDVWVIDPVDVPGLDEFLADLGTVQGVVLLLDRHKRDSAAIANRHEVPVYIPEFFDGVAEDLEAPVERFRQDLADSGFVVHEVVNSRFWQEAMLFDRDRGILAVPEAVGTTGYFLAGDERLGVHPMLRLKPPSSLTRLDPDRVLVGHGAGVHTDAAGVLEDAIRGSQARTPALVVKNVRELLPI